MASNVNGRSLSPNGQHIRIQSVSSEAGASLEDIPESGDVEGAPLLSDHPLENQILGRTTSQKRQPGWLFTLLFVVSVVAALTLAGALLSLNSSKLDVELHVGNDHLPRPQFLQDRYILNPAWDFLVPSQTREYEWTITDGEGRPDGVHRRMMLINNQFPGPLIEINEGDLLVVNVLNKASNATALHWHGISQNGTNWMDGAAGVTQCPIAPGQSYQYRFNVTGQSGTCK
jgi:FtsP/CotA-like multicopper oxidase with cupredoxin domain